MKLAKAEHEAASDLLWKHVDEQLAANPEAKNVLAYGADDITSYGRTKSGSKQVKTRPAEATVAA